MTKGLIKVLCVSGLLVGSALGVGCAGEAPTSAERSAELAQGLTVLEQSPTSLSVAFREKNITIFLQAKRGRPTAERYQMDPKFPKYEVDARFMDANGFIFYTEQGGDDWIDPTWKEDLDRQMNLPKPLTGSNEVLFRLATDMSKTLRSDLELKVGTTAVAEMAPVVNSLVGNAARLHAQFGEQFKLRDQALLSAGLPGMARVPGSAYEVTYGTPGPDEAHYQVGTAAQYKIALHADELDGIPGYAGGYHSATQRHGWNGGSVYWAHSTCNHGRCASGMTKRTESGYKAFAANELYALHCSGEYKWDSDGGSRGHNCHDDSRIQMHNFKYKSWMWGTQRWCDGGDNDHDISVDVFLVELDQNGYPEYSSSNNKGYGTSACAYTLGCSANWMGVGDGCDCQADGTWCGADTDCGAKPGGIATVNQPQ